MQYSKHKRYFSGNLICSNKHNVDCILLDIQNIDIPGDMLEVLMQYYIPNTRDNFAGNVKHQCAGWTDK